MARGTTLAITRSMLKAEIGASMTVGTADDAALNQMIESTQKWYASEYNWPFLNTHADVTAAVGTQYFTLPTGISFENPVDVQVKWSEHWTDVLSGIGMDEYNVYDTETADPIQKWRITDDGRFEVWPIPATQQTVRFYGHRPLTTLRSGGNFSDAALLDLDDLLIVYAVAAMKLASLNKPDAAAKKMLMEARLLRLRGAAPQPDKVVVLGANQLDPETPRRVVPITVA